MKTFVKALAIVAIFAAPAHADFFSPGTTNGWDVNGNPMAETFAGSGIWEYSWNGAPNTIELFDTLSESGNWDSKVWSSGNQWVYSDGNGDGKLILDTNSAGDGWLPDSNRIKVEYEPTTNWSVTGDFMDELGNPGDWDNAGVGFSMSDQGGGIYKYEAAFPAGNFVWKAVKTGSWDAIGGSSRNVNADNIGFTTDAVNNFVEMWVNVYDGTYKTVITPEPASLALLGFGALALIRRRR